MLQSFLISWKPGQQILPIILRNIILRSIINLYVWSIYRQIKCQVQSHSFYLIRTCKGVLSRIFQDGGILQDILYYLYHITNKKEIIRDTENKHMQNVEPYHRLINNLSYVTMHHRISVS